MSNVRDTLSKIAYIYWEPQLTSLINTLEQLENRIYNHHDAVAQEYYDNIYARIYELNKAVEEANKFYN